MDRKEVLDSVKENVESGNLIKHMPATAEIYKQIGKVAPSLQKRVIFITGDVVGAGTEAFLKKIKASHVTKPFDIAKLKEEVKHHNRVQMLVSYSHLAKQ